MLVSLNWLKSYVDLDDLTPEQLAEKITQSGIEVDGIHYVVKEKSNDVVVGYVKKCEKHPNADRLNLCQVDVGEETLQIICGAPNVAQGQKVAVAKPGAELPGGFKIKKVKLRGIESNGMICSLQELGVEEAYIHPSYTEGIVELPEDAEIGQSLDSILNLDDAILEFDLTPNRADALSMIGVAYEVAAILDKPINLPKPEITTNGEDIASYVTVTSEAPNSCPYYGAFLIKDIEIKQAPLWMQNRLLAAGIRPINNVVDITNYVLLEYGQPLHAFDFDLLNSKEIVVRHANDGEKIVTLDDQTRTLSAEHLLITDGKQGIALAGVMGGKDSEVNDHTKTVLLEAALFNGQTIRKAVQHTGLRSEASTRFEKGVDPSRVKEAGERATELLVQYANGTVVAEPAEYCAPQMEALQNENQVIIDSKKVNDRLGTEISNDEIGAILRKLRFTYENDGNTFTISVPTRRGDITIFEDMVEEVARIYGYNRLPYTLPTNASKPGGLTKAQKLKRQIHRYMQGVGLLETITYSLTNKENATKLVSPDLTGSYFPVRLAMPMSEDHEYLRQSLLPELLNRLTYNVARNQADVQLYEIGSVFLSEEEQITEQPKEHARLAAAFTGKWINHPLQSDVKQVDFFVVKGILDGLFTHLNVRATYKQAKLEYMHPGRCATVYIGEQLIGFIGQVHPTVTKEQDLKDTFVFDIDFEALLELDRGEIIYETVPKYPSILRDVAFVVNKEIRAGEIRSVIESVGAPLVRRVEAFDVYTGEHVGEDEKSIAFNIHYQDPEKTLTDEEVEASFQQIIAAVNEKFSARIRQ